MQNKKLYYATLYRFGYDLTVIADTREDAIHAIMWEYQKTYLQRNNGFDDEYETLEMNARNDIVVIEFTKGSVEWL